MKAQARRDWRLLKRDLAGVEVELRAAGEEIAREFKRELHTWSSDEDEATPPPRASRAERRARRRAERAAAEHLGTEDLVVGRTNTDRAGKRKRSRRACSQGGADGYWSWAWIVFPLVFWVIPSTIDWIDDRGGLGEIARVAVEAPLRLTLAGPIAGWLGDGLGMGFLNAFVLLAAAGLLTAGAAAFGWLGPRRV